MSKVRSSSHEEIPHVQGKEQWLHFAGAAVKEITHVQGKRNPSNMVGTDRAHQRADRLKHNHRQLSKLITQTTTLSNSMNLIHAMWGYPRWTGHGEEV